MWRSFALRPWRARVRRSKAPALAALPQLPPTVVLAAASLTRSIYPQPLRTPPHHHTGPRPRPPPPPQQPPPRPQPVAGRRGQQRRRGRAPRQQAAAGGRVAAAARERVAAAAREAHNRAAAQGRGAGAIWGGAGAGVGARCLQSRQQTATIAKLQLNRHNRLAPQIPAQPNTRTTITATGRP